MSENDQQAPSSSRLGSWGLSAWQMGRNAALGAAEYMTPVLTQSQFAEKGVLTPDEFVAAGDMLVLRCPTWQWQAGDPKLAKAFLPANKQFLITRNVPCQRRAVSVQLGADDEETVGGDGDDDWVATHTSFAAKAERDEDAPDMVEAAASKKPAAKPVDVSDAMAGLSVGGASSGSAAEANLEEMGAGLVDEDDACALDAEEFEDLEGESNIVKTRTPPQQHSSRAAKHCTTPLLTPCLLLLPITGTYDVSISYDKYYQCAHVWLYGYSESRQPLTQPEILQDISVDHALKTVSLEAHPHIATGAGLHASIHPCKHAAVMQKLTSSLVAAGRECRPEQYLFLFLKFISAICPTIEYDYTMSVDGL